MTYLQVNCFDRRAEGLSAWNGGGGWLMLTMCVPWGLVSVVNRIIKEQTAKEEEEIRRRMKCLFSIRTLPA